MSTNVLVCKIRTYIHTYCIAMKLCKRWELRFRLNICTLTPLIDPSKIPHNTTKYAYKGYGGVHCYVYTYRTYVHT